MMLLVIKEKGKNVPNDKGPNDLEWIIEKLKKENYRLEMEVEMLKKDIEFLREELQARSLEKRNDW
jgi:hypothetical protein